MTPTRARLSPRLAHRLNALTLLWTLVMPLGCAAALPIEHWDTSTGARVYFIASHDLPILDVSVDFAAGSGRDTGDANGLASLTQRLMRLGADGMNEDDIARQVADVGANLAGTFDLDRAGYALRTLSSEPEQRQALAVLARVLQAPSFPAPVLEREKARVIAGLKESDTKPDSIAARAFMQLVYRDHPYALRSAGEPATVAKLTRDDLVAFYRTHYTADRAVVVVVGDVARERAAQIAEELTRELAARDRRAPGAAVRSRPSRLRSSARSSTLPRRRTSSIGQPGVARNDPGLLSALGGQLCSGRWRIQFAPVRRSAPEAWLVLQRVQLLHAVPAAGSLPDRSADAGRSGPGCVSSRTRGAAGIRRLRPERTRAGRGEAEYHWWLRVADRFQPQASRLCARDRLL